MTETLTWVPVGDRLPDSDTTVLIALRDDSEPVWLGWRDGAQWLTVYGSDVTPRVTHWAEMPGGPA